MCRLQEEIAYSSDSTIFYWLDKRGRISYTDYLFLITLLCTSPTDIHLAFYVYDLNGDGQLDIQEFERVQQLLVQHSHANQTHRGDHNAMSSALRSGAAASSGLAAHFFGADGKQKLGVERFLKFQVSSK